jgi:hypothetical protein
MSADIDIYSFKDLSILAKIMELYDMTGSFSEIGNKGNGTVRNAIRKYFEFLSE